MINKKVHEYKIEINNKNSIIVEYEIENQILYFDHTTGILYNKKEDIKIENYRLMKKEETVIFGTYYQYQKADNLLLIGLYQFQKKKIQKTEELQIQPWIMINQIIIDEKKNIYQNKNNLWTKIPIEKVPFDFLYTKEISNSFKESILEIEKIFSLYFLTKENECSYIECPADFELFLKMPASKKAIEKEDILPNISDIELEEIIKNLKKEPNINNYGCHKFATILTKNESVSIIRLCYINEKTMEEKKYFEFMRIYISAYEKPRFFKKEGDYIYSEVFDLSFIPFDFKLTKLPRKESFSNNQIKFYYDILEEIMEYDRIKLLIYLYHYPIMEKLYKMGLKEIIQNILSYQTIEESAIIQKIGRYTEGNSIYEMLGINTFQFKKIYDSNLINEKQKNEILYFLKKAFAKTDIRSLDMITFEHVLSFLTKTNSFVEITKKAELCQLLILNYGMEICIKVIKEINDFTEETFLEKYLEYITIATQIKEFYKLKSFLVNDILAIETEIEIALVVLHRKTDPIYKKQFQKRKNIWKKWNYNNNIYAIISPDLPIELSYEGKSLHHCLGGYIERVANGETNVLFLREIENLENSFYTIEINNQNQVEQIKGMYNQSIEDFSLQEFIANWMKKKKLCYA